MRVGIPIWEERVSPVLDTAGVLLVIDLEDRREASRHRAELHGETLSRRVQSLKDSGSENKQERLFSPHPGTE